MSSLAVLEAPRQARPVQRPSRRRRSGRRGVLFAHETKQLLLLAGPVVLSQLGHVAMNTADTLMVAPLGAEILAAAGLGSALHVATIVLVTGIVLGMGPLVSQAFGARDLIGCRRVLVQGIWLSLALSLPMMAVTFAGGTFARLLGQDPAVAALAGDYLSALAWGVPPVLLFLALRQYLEGMGITAPSMWITLLGLGANVLLNLLLIHGVEGWIPALGLVGSGWATTLTRWGMLAAAAAYLWMHPRISAFEGASWRLDPMLLRRIGSIGSPIGAQLGVEVGLISLAAVMIGWFGAVPLAAHQITINLASLTFMVSLGVSLAGSIRVGQHIGAGNRRRVRRAVGATYLLAVGTMAVFALIFLCVPEILVGLYTRDPAILRLGTSLLLVAALFQVFDGAQVAGLCSLRGAADTRAPLVVALLGYWVIGVPVGYLLGFHSPLGPAGVWMGLCAALFVVAWLLALRVRRVIWAPL